MYGRGKWVLCMYIRGAWGAWGAWGVNEAPERARERGSPTCREFYTRRFTRVLHVYDEDEEEDEEEEEVVVVVAAGSGCGCGRF